MPLPESEKVFLDTVSEGVKTGLLGLRENTEVSYKEAVLPNLDSTVLRGEYAKKIKEQEGPGEVEEGKPIEPEPTGKEPRKGVVRRVSLRATIPWDKLSSIITGVIRPLKDKGLPPEIIVEIIANSEEGFDRTTLDSKVKETLRQINAEIEEWKED